MDQAPMDETVAHAGIITGAASGIGAATAVEFGRLFGARLLLVGMAGDDLEPIGAQVRAAGGTATEIAADVRDPGAMAEVATRAVSEFGRVDFVCANAGIAEQSHIDDGDPARWRAVLETNVLGVMHTVRAVVPQMKSQRSGNVIITASLSGRESYVGEPAYIASKWGIVGLGHSLRQELSPFGIRVTLIEPGVVATPLTEDNPKLKSYMAASKPLHAVDIASAVIYAYSQPKHVVVSELAIRPLVEAQNDFDWDEDAS